MLKFDSVTPIAEQSSSSTTDDSLNFMPDNSAQTNDKGDRYFKDTDNNIEILDRYPKVEELYIK